MLEKPALPDVEIVTCLWEKYAIAAVQVEFLPLGADQRSAVYRIVAGDGTVYFLKLRRGEYDEMPVVLPKLLGDQGVRQVIAPLTTSGGQLHTTLGIFRVILYPFVSGQDGYEVKLSDGQWQEFGAALKGIHTTNLPHDNRKRIRQEYYSSQWRDAVRGYVAQATDEPFSEPIAAKLADFLANKRDEVLYLVGRAEELGRIFQNRSPKFVLCHADVHAGNILIGDDGSLHIVDWDEAILAPKERDLMSIGGALMGGWYSPQEEEALFYPAYGQVEIDPFGLAYYRYERIIADIAVISQQIFTAAGSAADREQDFGHLTSNFLPGHTIEMAYRADSVRSSR